MENAMQAAIIIHYPLFIIHYFLYLCAEIKDIQRFNEDI